MRKVALVILLCICLSGCVRQDYGISDLSEKNLVAECTLNEKYELLVIKEGECVCIELLSPKNASGIRLTLTPREAYYSKGDMKIKVSREQLPAIFGVANVFFLTEENMVDAEASSGGALIFERDGFSFRVTYGKNSQISKARITAKTGTLDLKINGLEIK